MGKAAQRKRATKAAPAGDVHAQIAAEAKAAQHVARLAFQAAEKTPALQSLLDSASNAMTSKIPTTFEHKGRTYYLRVAIDLARVMVFETATSPQPMVFAVIGNPDEFGHSPYH